MYSCVKCRRSFASSRDLDHHINCRQTPCKPATHHCLICCKCFSSYKSLWNHKQRCQEGKAGQTITGIKSTAKMIGTFLDDRKPKHLSRSVKEDENLPLQTANDTVSTPSVNVEDLESVANDLQTRYKNLHYQFLWHGKHELIYELTSLLDELLRQGFISKDDYEIGTNNLTESINKDLPSKIK